jgi:type II secretion system protein G
MMPVFQKRRPRTQGFTIVELLIVVVVIAILAAITIVAYNNIQDRAKFSAMQTDLRSIATALELYKTDNLGYPKTIGQGLSGCTSDWCGWDQVTGDSFIPGLSPKYMSKIPQLPTALPNNNSYLYSSDGINYQLIRYKSASGLTAAETTNNPLLATTDGYTGLAWGYRTDTSRWW